MNLRPTILLLTFAIPLVAPSSVWLRTSFSPRAALAQDLTPAQLTKITSDFETGDLLTKAEKWDAAALEYDAILALQPPTLYSFKAYVLRGVVNRDRHHMKAAVADLTKALDLAPQVKDAPDQNLMLGMAYRNRGVAQSEMGKTDEALADFGEALKIDPQDLEALIGRGRAKINSLMNGDPMDDLEAAVKLAPRSSEALTARADGKRGSIITQERAKNAIPDYDAALVLDKNNAAAYFGRSQARDTLAATDADRQAARADLSRAIELDPTNAYYYVIRAIDETNDKGGAEAAIADYGHAIVLEPDNEHHYLDRAGIQVRQPKPDDAQILSDYSKVVEIITAELKGPDAPDDPFAVALKQSSLGEAFIGRGELYTRQGKVQEAIYEFNTALSLDATNIRAAAGRAHILILVGRPQLAIAEINAAMPRAREANIAGRGFAVRGAASLELEQWQDAVVDLNAAIKDDSLAGIEVYSRDAELYFNRGRAYNGLNQSDKALADFNIAVKLAPPCAAALKGTPYEPKLKPADPNKNVIVDTTDTPTAHKLLGNEWVAAKDAAKALAEYNQALALDANYADAYNNRGLLYRLVGQADKAMPDFDKAVALAPQDARFIFNRGTFQLTQGHTPEATADLQKAVALAPQDSAMLSALGTAQQAGGKLPEAEASYNKAITLAKTAEDQHLSQVRLVIVRAAQDKAPSADEMKMLLALSKAELTSIAAATVAQLKATPNVAALVALNKAVTDKANAL